MTTRAITYWCEPELHEGQRVEAEWFVRRASHTMTETTQSIYKFEDGSYACCTEHLPDAVKWLGGNEFIMYRVNQ